jgi:hypothetical protein
MPRTYPELTVEERAALQAFANRHGRKWKETLSCIYWPNARIWEGGRTKEDGYILHGIRNNFGPSWLYSVCDVRPVKES